MRRPTQPEFVDFYLPFDGKLRAENRWVKLAGFVPWELVEDRYAGALAGTGMGAPALPGRVAFGALVIKERLGITDEETVAQVLENPYLQHFLGFREMLEEAPFDASMMVHFRARFGQLDYDEINGAIIRMACGDDDSATPEPEAEAEEAPANCGKLLIDASCPPADITYPTDLKLLNATREKLEHIIDELHRPLVGNQAKPRTYRRVARRDFLSVTKLKRPGVRKIRKAIGKQLRYIRRDLRHVAGLVDAGARLVVLTAYDYRCLLVAAEVYRQQLEMWREKKHRVSDAYRQPEPTLGAPHRARQGGGQDRVRRQDIDRRLWGLHGVAPDELGRLQRVR